MADEDLGSVLSPAGDTRESYRLRRREVVARAAERWAKDLTDESGRNLLLYYRELKTGTLSLDYARASEKNRLLKGKKVRLQKLFAEDRVEDALRRVRAVKRKATVNYEEKGISQPGPKPGVQFTRAARNSANGSIVWSTLAASNDSMYCCLS